MIVLVIEKFNRFVSKNDFHISIEISNSRNMTPINSIYTLFIPDHRVRYEGERSGGCQTDGLNSNKSKQSV